MAQRSTPHQINQPPVRDFLGWLRKNVLYAIVDPEDEKRTAFYSNGAVSAHLAEQDNARLKDILYALFSPDEPPIDASTIISEYVAILCILIELNNGIAIEDFVNYGWNDSKLPFEQEPKGFPTHGENFYQRFCELQWKYCVPIFHCGISKIFEEKRILPIHAQSWLDQGGNATIYKLVVHGYYNRLHRGPRPTHSNEALRNTFALKTYDARDPNSLYLYRSEVEALRRLHNPPNRYLIGFHGNYTQGETGNLILEFADQGSLETYFEHTNPPFEEKDIIAFWAGIFGLYKALHTIHTKTTKGASAEPRVLNGWHQDVKPKNILVVSDGADSPYAYQFKLADFGLTHFHPSIDDGGSSTADDALGTQSYGAPECFRNDDFWDTSVRLVKQRVDVWCFGCVLSEAAVWVGKGYKGVLQYRSDRMDATEPISARLGDCFHDGQKVLNTIGLWHDSLRGTPGVGGVLRGCDQITPEVLGLIEEHMLIESDQRLDPQQLSGRAENKLDAVRRALSSRTQTVGTFSTSDLRQHQDNAWSPPAQRPSRETQYTPTNSKSRATGYNIPNPHQTSPILSGGHVEEPDTMSTYNEDFYGAQWEHGSPNRRAPTGPSRPISQPKHSPDRQDVVRPMPSDSYTSQGLGRLREGVPGWKPSYQRPHSALGINGLGNNKVQIHQRGSTDPNATNTFYAKAEGSEIPKASRDQYEGRGQFEDDEDIYDYVSNSQPKPPTIESSTNNLGRRKSTRTSQVDFERRREYISPGTQQSSHKPSQSVPDIAIHASTGNIPNQEAREAQKSARSKRRSAAEKLPYLAVSSAMEWKRLKKENVKLYNRWRKRDEPPLTGKYLEGRVGKRDHVFIIDDGESMRSHWSEMCQLFDILAYMVKKSDEDGLDLYFTMTEELYNRKNVSDLIDIIKKRKEKLEGPSNLNLRLNRVLTEYGQKLKDEIYLRRANSPHARAKDRKPLTVYILTNGLNWSKKSDPKSAISDIVASLKDLGCPASTVGIQFISFGQDPDALARMDKLDAGLELDMDIVDHTHSNGNVWKMILGAIDPDFDGDDDDDDEVDQVAETRPRR